jgi:hypothetical protein
MKKDVMKITITHIITDKIKKKLNKIILKLFIYYFLFNLLRTTLCLTKPKYQLISNKTAITILILLQTIKASYPNKQATMNCI